MSEHVRRRVTSFLGHIAEALAMSGAAMAGTPFISSGSICSGSICSGPPVGGRGHAAGLLRAVPEHRQRLSPSEELVSAQVTDGLDVEGRTEGFAVGLAHAR